jgi:glycosyltransferase involved in cell wall biosynthesis
MTTRSPQVTVCLPVYNGQNYVGDAIRSVLGQTFEDFELVISDNASTDGTAEICRRAAARDPRVRYFRADTNRGLAWNHNHAFALAGGRYVMWMGHDDVLAAEYLSRCLEVFEQDAGIVVSYAGSTYINGQGNVIKQKILENSGARERPSLRFLHILYEGMCDPIFGLMKRQVLQQTRLHGAFPDSDRVLLAEMALRGRFGLVPEYLFSRRLDTHNTTRQYRDLRERTAVFDPAKAGKIFFPAMLEVREFLSAIHRAKLPFIERFRCYKHLSRWVWLRRRALCKDTVRGLRFWVRMQLSDDRKMTPESDLNRLVKAGPYRQRRSMAWTLSRFRTGDLVEVRSKEEILATLDEHGCVDGMPFMPEMFRHCGQRFRVGSVAHKTCDTARRTWKGRRLKATLHLGGLRCDGSAHGGCQADCNLFWKDVWLKPAGDNGTLPARRLNGTQAVLSRRCSESRLLAGTHFVPNAAGPQERYVCQATKLYEATDKLAWWDPRQYIFDIMTGNHSVGRVLRVLWLGAFRWLLAHVPFGYLLVESLNEKMHVSLTGRGSPRLQGKIKNGAPTPTGRLDLKPGEWVRIKSKAEIEETLNDRGMNRGLRFDPEEMAPYCNSVVKVRGRVSKLIDELTGKMLHLKEPCIILEGVVCRAEYASCRLNCPRAIPAFWRELWVERVTDCRGTNGDLGAVKSPRLSATVAV